MTINNQDKEGKHGTASHSHKEGEKKEVDQETLKKKLQKRDSLIKNIADQYEEQQKEEKKKSSGGGLFGFFRGKTSTKNEEAKKPEENKDTVGSKFMKNFRNIFSSKKPAKGKEQTSTAGLKQQAPGSTRVQIVEQ